MGAEQAGPPGSLSALPSVERLRAALGDEHPHSFAVGAARRAIDEARTAIRRGEPAPPFEAVVDAARSMLDDASRHRLVPVVNATGVLLHTNLGRAPLGARQIDAVRGVAAGYSNLEYTLGTGERGSRHAHVAGSLRAVTGAEAALVINNNAAAVLVCLTALCGGREVIVSRGELVEIGGGFRIPDVLAASGALPVEVGTTNRTRIGDYERAITGETAAILKVHPSNYRVVGFTESVDPRDIARLARGKRILFIHDIGSGLMHEGLAELDVSEPHIVRSVEDGADLVTFSGDKLLGGPQAGVIVGRRTLIEKIERHPLMRAVRVDKMTLAALDATLQIYLEGAVEEIPLWAMASASSGSLHERASELLTSVGDAIQEDVKLEVKPHPAVTGGGSLPGADLPSFALAVTHPTKGAAEIARALRFGMPPVIAVVENEQVLVNLRSVLPDQDRVLREALVAALS